MERAGPGRLYAVLRRTTVIDGNEVVWVLDGQNHVSVDASTAGDSAEDSEGPSGILPMALTAILLLLGASAIGIALVERKRRWF